MPWQDVCPSVCLSHAGIESKRIYIYISSRFFSPSGGPIILVFPYQTGWQHSDGDPSKTGASDARRVRKITFFDQYRALSRSWCKIEPYLLYANRKPHPSFRMVPIWITFSDLIKVTIIQRQITWKWYNIQLYLQWRLWSYGLTALYKSDYYYYYY